MFIEERHEAILKIINESGRISIGDIQEKFDVSIDSARRDLRILEEKGLLKRTHGGAIPIMQVGYLPPRVRDMKNMEVYENYDAIAKRGAEFVKENDIVYLTGGSVGFLMLKHLPRNIKYTLVLNSVTLAEELKYWDNVTVYIVGGKIRQHGTASLVDSFATAFVKDMHFDVNLMTAGGADAGFGVSNGTDETATYQRAVIENSRRNILLMPNQKIGFKAFIKVCDVNKFDTLITDWDSLEEELTKIHETGVDVIVVEKEGCKTAKSLS
jgi:DeoR family transcriptional regulator, fructose operon transcriptional repressor